MPQKSGPGGKTRLIVMGPVPPPTHGVAISTGLVLANATLQERFDVEHLDTADRRPLTTMERWDLTNIVLGFRHLVQLIKRLRGRKGVVYLPLSGFVPAFLRDSLFIHAASLAGWRVAVHIRNATFRDFYESCHPAVKWWIRVTLGRFTALAVLGERLKPDFQGLVPDDRIAVVPNGTPDIARTDTERDPNLVLYLSNFLEAKGVVEAVEAALLIIAQKPHARILFVGDSHDRELELQLRARSRPAGARLEFLPAATGGDKERLLRKCSVFLFPPSGKEGHPRVVLEAICRGIPLVTTDRGTIADTVTDGDSAFVLDDPDPGELAERVIELLDDPDLRARMGAAARARYEAHFTQDLADQRLADWLGRVASMPRPGRLVRHASKASF